MLNQLKKNYAFAVVRGKTAQDALEISRHAIQGGIKNIEITFSTPNATDVIKTLLEEYASDATVVIGAGTVMTVDLAKEAILAGAQFLVSPHFSQAIQDIAQKHDCPYFPGCATATEIVTAMEAGCPIIKLFPGGQLGTGFIKDIHGPIPEVDLMPSGGVSIENVAEWKKVGACAVGVGSALSAKVTTEGYESVTAFAKEFMKAVEG
ncbi:bifunctional 2-keto-4-hydroxyglutarate aldolase/2-keto-3-deoxy-6-phosphogluconate aldolase [Streptococcus gallolyticus]|nr:bifunctional 2-keto-4-hydroxyglutarate aldolase/2-keto-3-deoxy-6-phosphogluconate aldolase [Streptococcus gallolyticus]MBY5041229.1 bifunctional 2-keto-4-hydroxyglutarate aldolase/2-keto-3-deoxy-6-phosphogluconate aldolase [Streptococcus gallolyticus]